VASASFKLVAGPAISVGGMELAVRARPAPTTTIARRFGATLTVRLPSGARRGVADTESITGLEVRAFPLRDRAGRGAVLVEQIQSVADEGMYGAVAAVWRCTEAGCE
jgi:hypothetical protein